MSDEFIIRHCSPTLAGLKTGNLFNCPFQDKEELLLSIRSLNQRLVPKGVRVIPMKVFEQKVLLYIYRPAHLANDFAEKDIADLLKNCGIASRLQKGTASNSLRLLGKEFLLFEFRYRHMIIVFKRGMEMIGIRIS